MNRLRSIWILTKCYYFLFKKFASGYSWNVFIVDMETKEGRERFTFRRTAGGHTFSGFRIRDGEAEPYEEFEK